MQDSSKARLLQVRDALEAAARSADRDPAEIDLIAVSKTFNPDDIRAVIAAGQRRFGENRVQESLAKWPDLREETPDITLDLIGPLQTNKVRDAIGLFDAIHTLDRMRLARALMREMERTGRRPKLFIQVNTGSEPQKSGVLPEAIDPFIAEVRDLGLDPVGLMCIPPVDQAPGPHFALLRKIAARNGLARLSMGMSHDFETAIQFGATDIRVGTAIFGERTTAH